MNRAEFFRVLQTELNRLPYEEVAEVVRYYNEYFDEAGIENEQKVLEELGSPSAIATQIKADFAVKCLGGDAPSAKKGISALWLVLLAIFASPIALPLAIAAAAVAFALVITAIAVIFSLFATIAALIIAGIAMIGGAIVSVPYGGFVTAAMLVGAGLVLVGISLLLGVLLVLFSRVAFKQIAMLMDKLTRRNKGGKQV